jgi:uncharacterized membrane protein
MLTVEGAYLAYALVSRDTQALFGLVAFLSALAFVASVYASGRGITEARNAGFEGNWNLTAGKVWFNFQALALMLGLLLLAVMLLLSGSSRDSDAQKKVDELSAAVTRVNQESADVQKKLVQQMNTLSLEVDSLSKKIQDPPVVVPAPKASSPKKSVRGLSAP